MSSIKTKRSIHEEIKIIKIVLISTMVASIALVTGLVLASSFADIQALNIALGVLSVACAAATLISGVIFIKKIRVKMIDPLIEVTSDNMEKITRNNYVLDEYKDTEFAEFDQLNDTVARVNERYNTLVVSSSIDDLNTLGLEKDSAFGDRTITSEAFFNNIASFINISKVFRNAFVSFVYNTKENDLTNQDMSRLVDTVKEVFEDNNPVICVDSATSLIAFIPNIDSVSILKEKLAFVQRKSTVAKFDDKATQIVTLKASAAIYPYSSLDSVIKDLRYAERRGEDINIYLPERREDTDSVSTDAKRINTSAEIIERLNTALAKKGNVEAYRKEILECASGISDFLGFEGMSVLVYNDVIDSAEQIFAHTTDKERSFVIAGEVKELLTNLSKCCDKDGSFTFFDRKNVTTSIGSFMDVYNIKSGHLSLIYNNGAIYGALFFVNFTKKLVLDAATRESLVVFSNIFSSSLKELYNRTAIEGANARLDSLLLYTNYQMYTVNKKDYSLVATSRSIADAREGMENVKCYKAIYGLEQPCEDCPILTGKKKRVLFDGKNYSYHTVLSNKENRSNATFFLEPIDRRNIARERYDGESKLASSYTFALRISDKWNYNLKGELVLINISNLHEIISTLGEHEYHQYLRTVADALSSLKISTDEIFQYNSSTVAIILNECKRDDLFKIIEKIEDTFETKIGNSYKDLAIKKSYRVFPFPLTYATSFDFIRSIEGYFNSNNTEGDNNLYIVGEGISRPASRKAYILSLLNKAFADKNFDLRIQPIISKETNVIVGGEALLRLKDELTNTFFDAGEFIPIAFENNSMNKFTNIFIEQIGRLYKTYGATLFRTGFLDRINLNVDSSYFHDPEFLNDMDRAFIEYNFQKGFIAFEFNESDIAANQDIIKKHVKKLQKLNIAMIVDQYTGRDMSIEALQRLGFSEIKIARSLVMEMDTNPNRLNEIRSLFQLARTFNFKTTLVGVERREQVNLVAEDEGVNNFEGWYFFKPLEIDEFLSLLRNSTSKQIIKK
ncbi:MAG: EAL domain-containing protein [Bacilli bacterium]|nr:EAL domain-containing protein [Bacilli bacterium]